jgi:putative transposase
MSYRPFNCGLMSSMSWSPPERRKRSHRRSWSGLRRRCERGGYVIARCILNMVDDVTKECPRSHSGYVDLGTARGAGTDGHRRAPRQARDDRFRPRHRVHNAMLAWSKDGGIDWHFIAPGKPMQNGFIESFNGRMRDELLNETLFFDLDDARAKVAAWPQTIIFGDHPPRCNTSRPRPTPQTSPQRTIGYAAPTSSADRPLLHLRHMAHQLPRF